MAQIGEVFESAVVKRVDASLGLVLDLPATDGATPAVPAFAHISALTDTQIDKIGKVRSAASIQCHRHAHGGCINSNHAYVHLQCIKRRNCRLQWLSWPFHKLPSHVDWNMILFLDHHICSKARNHTSPQGTEACSKL